MCHTQHNQRAPTYTELRINLVSNSLTFVQFEYNSSAKDFQTFLLNPFLQMIQLN